MPPLDFDLIVVASQHAARRVVNLIGPTSIPFAAAGAGTAGTAMASSQESSMAVSDSHISPRICCSTARRALGLLTFAAVQRGADLAQQALHAADRKVEVHRKGCAQMLKHLIALAGLVL